METTETLHSHHNHLICWKSLFAGLAVTMLCYLILTALGAGIGGMTASNLIMHEDSGSGLATGAGLWLGISAVISLFAGGYFAIRVSQYKTNKVGVSHGAVIAALFFVIAIWGLGKGAGSVAKGLANTAMAATSSAATLANNPAVQDTLQKALGTSNLKSEPSEVAEGLAVRLLQGDTASAKSYLAYQTGQSETEVDQRVTALKADFDQKVKAAGEKTADAVATAGWSLFLTMVLGLVAAAIGGTTAARSNAHKPFAIRHTTEASYRNEFVRV